MAKSLIVFYDTQDGSHGHAQAEEHEVKDWMSEHPTYITLVIPAQLHTRVKADARARWEAEDKAGVQG